MLVLICFWWVIFFVMSLRIEIFLRFILNRGIVQPVENISIGLLSSRSRRRSHFMSFLRLNRSLRLLILLLIPILVLLIVFPIFLAIISIVVVWRLFIPVTLILLLLIIFTTELIFMIFLVFRSILILISEWSFIILIGDLGRISAKRKSRLWIIYWLLLLRRKLIWGLYRSSSFIVLCDLILWAYFVNLRMLKFHKVRRTLSGRLWGRSFLWFSMILVILVSRTKWSQWLLRIELRCRCTVRNLALQNRWRTRWSLILSAAREGVNGHTVAVILLIWHMQWVIV